MGRSYDSGAGAVSNLQSKLEALEAAKRELSGAEIEFERLLREIPLAARAEKTTLPEVIEAAFSKLRAAKSKLNELETLFTADSE
jgi:hypothetical protein